MKFKKKVKFLRILNIEKEINLKIVIILSWQTPRV